MAYDEVLAERLRETLGDAPTIIEKKMFGGLAIMEQGNLLVGVMGDDLIARIGPDSQEAALALPGARKFDFTGRPMRGWVIVSGEVLDDDVLADWVGRARKFVLALPPKQPSGRTPPTLRRRMPGAGGSG
jgi:TfoX/Sxy family transcriptional regulator of competence genes